ncbi:MAG TPA: N-6 DNA methylase [Roseiarcus sp.]
MRFVEEHGGRIGDIVIYGQESNYTTWRLCKMNLAVRGIDADIKWNSEGSFHKDELRDLKADFVLANPPFTFPIGAATGCARMSGGSMGRGPAATPTLLGCAISCITFRGKAWQVCCWRTARCRRRKTGKM